MSRPGLATMDFFVTINDYESFPVGVFVFCFQEIHFLTVNATLNVFFFGGGGGRGIPSAWLNTH